MSRLPHILTRRLAAITLPVSMMIMMIMMLVASSRIAHAGGGAMLAQDRAVANALDALDGATLVPADVSLYVQLNDAARLRQAWAGRSILDVVPRAFAGGAVGDVWTRLARDMGEDSSTLFDLVCGRRCALAMRPRAARAGAGPRERTWVLLAQLRTDELARAVRPLQPRRLAPRHDLPIIEIPEHALLAASNGTTAVFGPSRQPELFHEVLAHLAGVAAGAALADSAAVMRGVALGAELEPAVALVARHELPLGGWSVVVAASRGDEIVLRHASEFAQPPFTRPVPHTRWRPETLGGLEQHALATIIEPTEIGLPTQGFVEAMLGEPLLDPDARRDLGGRQMLVLGEAEGRLEHDAVDLMVPTFGVAIEVDAAVDPDIAAEILDRNMVRMGKSLERLGRGTFELQLPSLRRLGPGDPRRIDLDPAAAWMAPGFPALRGVSLNWRRVDGPHGQYWVVTSHPQQLETMAAALERTAPHVDVPERAWSSCGSLDGRRAAIHLRSWADNVEVIAPGAPADAAADFRATAELFAGMSDAVQRCRWMLARPTEQSVELEVTLHLAPRRSGS